ncbi:hypothetical protein P7H17_00070 [Paenibacillus larvae]|nr:hypothetical protein [Paenibacillus larvae]MDT2284838.1 hypothetical protein [Paenibacillus larvae]
MDKNIAVVAGQGEGEDRKIVTVGTSTGLNRHEMFVDARDVGTQEEGSEPLQKNKSGKCWRIGDKKNYPSGKGSIPRSQDTYKI